MFYAALGTRRNSRCDPGTRRLEDGLLFRPQRQLDVFGCFAFSRPTGALFRNRFRKPRDGRTGRYVAHETDAHDADKAPNSEEEDSFAEESDITTAFEREMVEVASAVEDLEDTLDVQDVEDRDQSSSHTNTQTHNRQTQTRNTQTHEPTLHNRHAPAPRGV